VDKAHDIQRVFLSGTIMHLRVDGKDYQIDIVGESERLRSATKSRGRISNDLLPAMEFIGRMWMKIYRLTGLSAESMPRPWSLPEFSKGFPWIGPGNSARRPFSPCCPLALGASGFSVGFRRKC
jgi:hypothetical protein